MGGTGANGDAGAAGGETRRIREPAAWTLVGWCTADLVFTLARLAGAGAGPASLRARAHTRQSDLFAVSTPLLLAAAVVIAVHAGPVLRRARPVVGCALAVLTVRVASGLVCALLAMGWHGSRALPVPPSERVLQTSHHLVALVVYALTAYWLLTLVPALPSARATVTAPVSRGSAVFVGVGTTTDDAGTGPVPPRPRQPPPGQQTSPEAPGQQQSGQQQPHGRQEPSPQPREGR